MVPPDSATLAIGLAEQRAILLVTCLAAFLFFNSFGSIGVALPAIQKQFGNGLAEIQWITLLGVATISTLSFCFGRAGSRFGQRRLYKLGVALYAAGAGLGAISTSFVELLGARAVMAVGLAMALPMSTAILAASFLPRARGQALGLFASAIAVGRMTGPAVGGFLVQLGSWHWIFLMNFILGVAVTLAVLAIFKGPGERCVEVFDTWGALALLIGYPSLLIGFTFGATLGWYSAPVISAFVAATVGLVSFVWIELHTTKPLIDVAIFRESSLAGALSIVVLSHVINQPVALAAPLYLQNGLAVSGVVTGLILAILPLATAFASPMGGRLADRFDAWLVTGTGVALLFFGTVGYAALGSASRLTSVGAVLATIGAGIGLMTPAIQKIAFGSVRQEDYGVLAAMLSSFGTAAGTIGITITVALMDGIGGKSLWHEPATFASAQRFAFACLAPLGIVALRIAFKCRTGSAKTKL